MNYLYKYLTTLNYIYIVLNNYNIFFIINIIIKNNKKKLKIIYKIKKYKNNK